MSSNKEYFVVPGRYKQWTYGLIGVGVLSLIIGFIMYGGENHGTRFWTTLLQNSVYFLLTVNAAMFFFTATTLAMGGWPLVFRRVTEAISASVIPIGVICFIILMCLIFGGHSTIYGWLDKNAVAHDEVLKGKSGFLNPTFFTVYTILTIGLWIVLGWKMRDLSRSIDEKPLSIEEGKRYIFTNTIWAAIYIVWFALTVASVVPWLWLMSMEAHWFSTMYSWYTFGSTFVSGLALMSLFVVYFKNEGYLPYVNREHLHDLGKFMFAFSIFWTYLWFSQYMLIWYANIPEETTYFKIRVQGPFRGIFFLNLVINFICPLLILMKRSAKRNWTLMTFMAVLIIFGHWIDFWQMVMPGTLKDHAELMPFEFGTAAFFIGIIMWRVGIYISKNPLLAKNHPFLKESMIHHT